MAHKSSLESSSAMQLALNILLLYMLSLCQLKNKFMKKIPRDAEASNVLIGEVDFLERPVVSFVRLAQATTLGGLTEVPVPTRWVLLMSPFGLSEVCVPFSSSPDNFLFQ